MKKKRLLGIGREEFRDLDKSLQRQAAHRLRAFAQANIPRNVRADLEVRVGRPAEVGSDCPFNTRSHRIGPLFDRQRGRSRRAFGAMSRISDASWQTIAWSKADSPVCFAV